MLYIISAPSGGGKTSLMRAVVSKMENLIVSVSTTTRPPRPLEMDGVNYHFVTPADFERMIDQKDFLEYAKVFGHFYGTSKTWVTKALQDGKELVLEIDWQGAQQIRKLFPQQSLSIFILPPSLEILRERLKERKQDSEEIIEKRMKEAKSECAHIKEFDYIVINDYFDTAVAEIESIILSARLRCDIQCKKHEKLLETLLK
jgi:guanylate kinase